MERMSATVEEILDGLDDAQRAAATAVDGPVRIIAGRGRWQNANRNPQNRLCVRNQSMESTKHDGGHVLRQGGGGNAQPTVEA